MTSNLGPVAVTGVTGLVGRALARALADDGVEVRGYSRDPVRALRDVSGLARAAAWVEDGALDGALLSGAHGVVHLAGENVGGGRWTDARKRAIEASRVEGTRRLVRAIEGLPEAVRPRVLVSASAIGFYGDTGQREADEESPKGEGFLADVCERWESAARDAERLGVRVVILRIGLVMSARGGALERMAPLYRAGLGGRMGSGRQWWPWVHLADVTGLVRFALEDERVRGVLGASAPGLVQQAEFSDVLARVLRRPALVPAPAFAIRVALGEFADEVLGSRRVVPRRALALGYRFRFPQLEPALRDLLPR